MKKNLPLLLIIILLVAGGYLFYSKNKLNQSLTEKINQTVQQTKKQAEDKLLGLIEKNIKLKCTYEIPDQGKATTYIYGKGKIRTTLETKEGVTESILVNNKLYSWSSKTKEGITMTLTEPIKEKSEEESNSSPTNPKEYLDQLKKFKAQCQQVNFSDDVFNPPKDVKFQDLDQLQKMFNEQQQKMNDHNGDEEE